MKKVYKISIGGESDGWCYKELSDDQYELIKDIFDQCESEYVGGEIEEVERKYVVKVWEAIDEPGAKHPNMVQMCGYKFVNDKIIKFQYPSYVHTKKFYHFFNTKEEAKIFSENESKRLGCEITEIEYNEEIY